MKIKSILFEINDKDDYIAPSKQIVFRAEHSGKTGNWFAFSKNDAIGYANHGSEIVKTNIGSKKFVSVKKLMEYGTFFDDITQEFPKLFKINNNGSWDEYELDVGLTKYFETIKPFLKKHGYDGVATYKKLSVDYEIYVYDPKLI